MKEKRVLVTGGAGFVGSHLCEQLIKLGNHVVCVDDLSTGSRANIHHLIGRPNFEMIVHDITNPLYIDINEIYNLACPASPKHYQTDPIKTIKTNVIGSINMLGLAKRTGARILQASTSEIYGDPQIHPQRESYWGNVNPVGIRSCYDEGKRCAETLFFDYHRQHQIDIKVARIFNTYGPHMCHEDGRVIPNFITQALKNEPITIYGDGLQTRSFCYVDDLISALIKFMGLSAGIAAPMNLGNPIELTVLELAHTIIRLTNSSSTIKFCSLPVDDPTQRRPDISLAHAHLNWQPKVQLELGLKRTIEYFSSNSDKQTRVTG